MTHVLIVDDKEENLYYLQALLTAEGYVVESARHGAEALVLARKAPPDVIISDLLMPVMDGYTLLRHWKGDPRLLHVPFIVYTATYTEPEDERLALSLGADAFILKPAEPDDFLQRLRAVEATGVAAVPTMAPEQFSDEAAMLQGYSETLIRKLEQKTMQLEEANRALQEDILARAKAETALREMADRQIAILNALPAHIALVDADGMIVSVNEAWRRFATANVLQGPEYCIGQNYLSVCEQATGECAEEAKEASAGIRRVLQGIAKEFVIEYPCHSPNEPRWFRLMVTPLREGEQAGAVVMHVNITERKLSEDAVAESEQRLSFAMAAADIGDWSLDLRTNVTHRALRHDQCFGYGDLLPAWGYDTFLAHVDPADRDRIDACFKKAVKGAAEYDDEFRVTWPDGSLHWLWTRGRFYFDEAGQPYRVAGIVTDITARKHSEKALERALERLTEAQRIGQIGDWEWDIATQAISWSPQVFEILGRDPALGPPRDYNENAAVFDPPSQALMLAKVTLAMETGEPQDYELVAHCPNGAPVDVLGRTAARKDASGKVVGLYGTIQEITERKQTEEALRRSEALFRTLVQTSWDGFHLVEPTGMIIYESPSVTRLLGYLPEEMVGHNALEFIHPEDVAEIMGGVDLLAAPGALRTVTLRVRHKDGRWRCVESYETNLLDHPDVRAIAVNYRDITERVEAEKAARRLAAIVESSADAIIGKDTSGNITSWNRGAERVFGYTEREMVGTSIMRLIPPDREGEEHYIIETVLRGESLEHFETKRLTKDGRLIDVAVTASPIRDRDGIVIGVSKLARDITARKAAEASAKQLLSVLEASLNEIYIFDAGTLRFDYVNESARRNLGFSMETMRGLTPAEIMPEFSLERIAEFVAPLRRHEQGKIVSETVHRRADGTLYPVELHLQFVEREGHDVFLAVVIDLTERKRAEAALHLSENEFRTLAEAMPQMVWITGRDGLNVYFNQRWTDYTGLTAEECAGHGWVKPFHPEDQERAAAAWRNATEGLAKYSIEARLRRADGAYRWWLVRGVPQRDAAGEIVKWFGTCTDIHDLKQADLEIQSLNADLEERVALRTAELFNATQEAERANQSKSDFLSRTSHELRTPLNAILGFGQLLEREGRDPEEADNIEQILRAGRHLLGLINEMLDISRIEAGQLEFALQAVPLSETIGEALAIVRPMAMDRGITIDPFQSSAHIVVDRQRFKQVVLNLLSNAVKYNHPGGRVTCSVTELDAERLRFSVTDTGIGIAAADAGKVFTAFERFGVAATQVEGIGLGLAITRQLTELMGGKIGFESELGTGSTFWIDLPRAGKPHVSLNTPAEVTMPGAASLGGGPSRLLYIEDNVSNLRLVTRIIARRPQVEFLSATNGTLGLEMARTLHPDMILLDLHLPDIQGDEVLRQLLADATTAAIPVIMLSADAVPARRAQLIAGGARAFLTKPLEIRAFLAVVDEFLPS